MRTREQVSDEKLRGGFYTPQPLVHACLDRVAELLDGRANIRLLEPSAGDGAFIRGLSDHRLRRVVDDITAVELIDTEAKKARLALAESGVSGVVVRDSFLQWAASHTSLFDAAVGNPPFVRFQFVDEIDRRAAALQLEKSIGIAPTGVSNLWIPMLLRALTLLRPGGAFAFVVPAELLTGISADLVRTWLRDHVRDLQLDMFEPGSFPGVLQEVMVVSGRVESGNRGRLSLVEHRGTAASSWVHLLREPVATWTRYLLQPRQLEAFDLLRSGEAVRTLGEVARFEVSIVTGSNEFFTVSAETVLRNGLEAWAKPLLPRIRHAVGLRYDVNDHDSVSNSSARSMLLHFSSDASDPRLYPLPRKYLETGVDLGIADRYKCRIRNPWYRVPSVRAGTLMLSKRSHVHPRMVVNEANVMTTDTIYRGRLLGDAGHDLTPHALAAAFHSSMTILGAEIEGRSFGGGVLELVPTEIARLPVVAHGSMSNAFESLDRVARNGPQNLIDATDQELRRGRLVDDPTALQLVAEARHELMSRRLIRNEMGDRSLPVQITIETSDVAALAEVS